MNSLRPEDLENKAAEQRRRIDSSVNELTETFKEKVNVTNLAREHLLPISAVGAVVGLILGYGLTGIFVRR
jgi:hypothetical protein